MPGSRTMKPPLIQPSPICGFSVKCATRSPSKMMPPKRAGGRTAVTVASRPVDLWKRSSSLRSTSLTPSPYVSMNVSPSSQGFSCWTRFPVLVLRPVSMTCTVQSSGADSWKLDCPVARSP